MTPHQKCRGVNRDGSLCRAPANLVDDESGFCRSHDPEKHQAIIEQARKGGEAMARRLKRRGLSESELPPLNSPEIAEIWLERIARAVATGRLGHNEARSATAAIQQWLKAHEAGRMADRLDALREQLESIRRRQ